VGKSECDAMLSPNASNALEQPLDGHASGLATFGDRLNVRCWITEPQNLAHLLETS
jgi:hypothetical protein